MGAVSKRKEWQKKKLVKGPPAPNANTPVSQDAASGGGDRNKRKKSEKETLAGVSSGAEESVAVVKDSLPAATVLDQQVAADFGAATQMPDKTTLRAYLEGDCGEVNKNAARHADIIIQPEKDMPSAATTAAAAAPPKLKGKKARDARRAARAAEGGGGAVAGLSCRVCSATFPSRSKLFAHIKATGHAFYVEGDASGSAPKGGRAKGTKGKKGKRGKK